MNYDFEHIDDYIHGKLGPAESLLLEQQMQEDASLAAMVKEYRQVSSSLSKMTEVNAGEGEEKLLSILDPLTKQHFPKKSAPVITMKRVATVLSIAACLAFIITLFIPGTNPGDFTFSPMPGGAVRGNQTEISTAATLFNEKKYEAAGNYLEPLFAQDSSNSLVANYLTIAYLKQKKFEKALPIAMNLANGNSVYKKDANFYTAYCFYKTGDTKKAVQYAEKVSKEDLQYPFAQVVLKEIKKKQ